MSESPSRPGRRPRRSPQSVSRRRQSRAAEPEYLIVGQIIRPHGVRGELAMKLITDYPDNLKVGKRIFLGPELQPQRLKAIRPHREGALIRIEGVEDRDAADLLRGQMVQVHLTDAIPLAEGEYYMFQLQGIQVVTEAGEELGRFDGYLETGANDVYIIRSPRYGEILLPAIPDVIRKVDIAAGQMTVHLIDGLLPSTAEEEEGS